MIISEALDEAAELLRDGSINDSRREATLLLGSVVNKDKAYLIAHANDELHEAALQSFKQIVERRSRHEPFQYIVGRQEFYGLDIVVSPAVLIPRPETELLVEQAVEILSPLKRPAFLEIGIGSGCLSIAILAQIAAAHAMGVDISGEAVAMARLNAEKNSVADRLRLQRGDLFEGLSGSFDLIVSNPPYVPRDQLSGLQPEISKYEPPVALDGGLDGLGIIRRLILQAPDHLKMRGAILIEIGFDQAEKVRQLFDPGIWETPEFIDDLQSWPRIVKARLL